MVVLGWSKGQICFSPPHLPLLQNLGQRKGVKKRENFKSALSPLFIVGLGLGKGQICLSTPQLPPPQIWGGGKGKREEKSLISSVFRVYG